MIDFYETTLLKNIRKIVLHPSIKPYLFTTSYVNPADLSLYAVLNPKITIYALRINHQLAGLGVFSLENKIASVDVCFLPQFSGKDKKNVATRAMEDYVTKKHPAALIAKVRRNNLRSLVFAKWCKFHVEQKNEQFFYLRRNYG